MLKVRNPARDIWSCPTSDICRAGNLPTEAARGIDVDWSGASFVSISQVAAISAIRLGGKAAGVWQESLPSGSADNYMSRMNYYKLVGAKRDEHFSRHDAEDRFVPLSAIPVDENEADPNGVASMLRSVITSHLDMSGSLSDMLDYSFGEMLDNIVQHSRSASPGVAGAQYYKSGPYVEVCVADAGVGIAKSMSGNPSYAGTDEGTLVSMAFRDKTGEFYGRSEFGTRCVSAGMGLAWAARLVRAVGGHIWAITRDTALHISSSGEMRMQGLYYPGTLIVMRVPETEDEVPESAMVCGGNSRPIRWNPDDGLYTTNNGILW